MTNNGTPHLKSAKNQNRRMASDKITVAGGWGGL